MAKLDFYTFEYLIESGLSAYGNMFSEVFSSYRKPFSENGLLTIGGISMWEQSMDAISCCTTSIMNSYGSMMDIGNAENFYGATTDGLLEMYNLIMTYEKEYRMSSEELIKKWQENTLVVRNLQINDWISTYLQVKDFIKV